MGGENLEGSDFCSYFWSKPRLTWNPEFSLTLFMYAEGFKPSPQGEGL